MHIKEKCLATIDIAMLLKEVLIVFVIPILEFSISSSQKINDPISPFKRRGDGYLVTSRESEQKALILLADDSEGMEGMIVNNILRSAGIKTYVAGMRHDNRPIRLKYKLTILPDTSYENMQTLAPYDVIVLSGGLGYKLIGQSEVAVNMLKEQDRAKRFIAAMSLAQMTLLYHQISFGRNITAHPEYDELFKDVFTVIDQDIVFDGHLITSKGPAHSIDVGLYLVELLRGSEVANRLAKDLDYRRKHHIDFW